MLDVDEATFVAACAERWDAQATCAADGALSARVERSLSDGAKLDFELESCTPFRRAVLDEVARIPRGQVRTYAEVAASVGSPRAARAVGEVMRTNPIPVLIPCHRVVRSSGAPGNYSPRPELKAQLLEHEGWAGAG
jgi:O-6-methylguanine DNA methyltransferase